MRILLFMLFSISISISSNWTSEINLQSTAGIFDGIKNPSFLDTADQYGENWYALTTDRETGR